MNKMILKNNRLKDVIELNGMNLLTIENGKYKYKSYKGSYVDDFESMKKPKEHKFLKSLKKDNIKVIINSDVFDLFNEKQKINSFRYKDILECYYSFLINSVDFIASIAEENDEGVLIQNTYSEEKGLRSEEHTSELQSRGHLVCRLLLEKKKQQ